MMESMYQEANKLLFYFINNLKYKKVNIILNGSNKFACKQM